MGANSSSCISCKKNIADYLIGPVSVVTTIGPNNKQIIILSDYHPLDDTGLEYTCPELKPGEVELFIDEYLPKLVKNTGKFIDIFL